jgi:hypothetical protein
MRTALTLVLLAIAGCSSASAPKGGDATPSREDLLTEVGQLLRAYPAKGGKVPAKVGDLAPYEMGGPLGYAAVKSGEIVVVWGATMAGEGDAGGAAEIVAYEKAAPTDGGAVLLQNGQVKKLSAAEFASAPKASGKK